MAPAVTAAGTSSQARLSLPWAALTIPSVSCVAYAGEWDPLSWPQRREEKTTQLWAPALVLGAWVSRISGMEGTDQTMVPKVFSS